MCATITLDRQAHRGIYRPLHPIHQTRGCSPWQSENREKGLSLNKGTGLVTEGKEKFQTKKTPT